MNSIIIEFWKRRKYRLFDRGIRLDDGEENKNNKNNKGKKNHGNTRLPFGLCKKEGIEIKPDWTPKDAWDALKGKGYNPGEEYKKIGGEKKGTTKEEPSKEEPIKEEFKEEKKQFEFNGSKYTDIYMRSVGKMFNLYGIDKNGDKKHLKCDTKENLIKKLKEQGYKSITIDGDEQDISNWEEEKPVATISGKDYYSFKIISITSMFFDGFGVKGIDKDGNSTVIGKFNDADELERYLKYKNIDINADYMNITDDVRSMFEDEKKAISEKEERTKKQKKLKNEIKEENKKPEYSKISYFGGDKYVKDIKIVIENDRSFVIGTDALGNTIRLSRFLSNDSAEEFLDSNGVSNYDIGSGKMSEDDTLEYNGKIYNNISIEKDKFGRYYFVGRIKGERVSEDIRNYFDTEKDAREYLNQHGVNNYTISGTNTNVIGIKEFTPKKKPTYGMRKVSLVGTDKKGYTVFADTKRFGEHQKMFEAKTIDECIKWLNENNVQNESVKKVVPLPNHYLERSHTAKSLDGFDQRREDFISESSVGAETISSLSDEKKNNYTDMMSDVFKNGAYRMRRKPSSFSSIILSGRFKNQFETGKSSGLLATGYRRDISKRMFGTPDGIDDVDREKYGYLGYDNDEEETENETGKWYGSIIFKFKKDAVESDSTYTLHDSLDSGAMCAGYCGNNATIEGLGTCSESELRSVYDVYKRYKNGEITYNKFLEGVTTEVRDDGYLEIQYHGELTTDKIESIMFGDATDIDEAFRRMDTKNIQKTYNEMKKLGIPIKYKKVDRSYYGQTSEYADVLEYMKNKYNLVD